MSRRGGRDRRVEVGLVLLWSVVIVERSTCSKARRQARSISSALSKRRAEVAPQRLREEGRQRLAQARVEQLAVERHLAVEHGGSLLPSPQRGSVPVAIS